MAVACQTAGGGHVFTGTQARSALPGHHRSCTCQVQLRLFIGMREGINARRAETAAAGSACASPVANGDAPKFLAVTVCAVT